MDTLPVLEKSVDTWEIAALGMKDISNFDTDNWTFRKDLKQQIRRMKLLTLRP